MSASRYSLAFRVGGDLLFASFALFACVAATVVLLTFVLDVAKQKQHERSLDDTAQFIASHLQIDPTGEARLAIPPATSSAMVHYPAVVFDRNGRILFEQPAGLDRALIDALSGQRLAALNQEDRLVAIRFFTLDLDKKRIVGAALHTGSGDDERVIEVVMDENAPDVLIDDIVRDFPYQSARMLLPLFALLLLTGTWIVWRRMWPIARALEIAATIGPHTLNLRLPERKLPAEVRPIVQGINSALERLERAAEMQHEFLRRAAHQLRTPMMTLSARADSLDVSETGIELRQDVKELSRIVSQLLLLNEIDALPDRRDAMADLTAVGEAVRDEMAPRAAAQDKRIELVQPDAPMLVRGDPNVIEIAVRNLVENAIEHSPPGSTIGLRIGADACLEVVDAGQGFADELRDRIFEPFWSGDPHGGHAGLGLTIVSRVAERYGASLTVTAVPGGACFAMHFQPARVRQTDLNPAVAGASVPASLVYRRRLEALGRAAD